MKAKHFASLVAAILAAFLFFGTVAGCGSGNDPNGGVTKDIPEHLVSGGGKFESQYGDGYIFTKTKVSQYYDPSSSETFTIVGATQFSAGAGVIVYQFPDNYTYSIYGGPSVPALYGAVYYRNLTENSVEAGSTYAASVDDVKVRSLSAPGSSLQGTVDYYFDPANEPTEAGYGSYTKQ
jgi:hypothetical protein